MAEALAGRQLELEKMASENRVLIDIVTPDGRRATYGET